MKNESGTKEDISMLDALQRLWHHKAKRKPIVFVVTFPDVSRKVTFAKVWSRIEDSLSRYWGQSSLIGDDFHVE